MFNMKRALQNVYNLRTVYTLYVVYCIIHGLCEMTLTQFETYCTSVLQVVGSARRPRGADRTNMPYTEACISEIHRLASTGKCILDFKLNVLIACKCENEVE